MLGPRAKLLWEVSSGSSLRALAIQSAFNCIIPWILIASAVREIDAGLAAILNSLSPIFIFLLTALVTRHEPVTGRKFVGVALGIGGVFDGALVMAAFGLGTLPNLLAAGEREHGDGDRHRRIGLAVEVFLWALVPVAIQWAILVSLFMAWHAIMSFRNKRSLS